MCWSLLLENLRTSIKLFYARSWSVFIRILPTPTQPICSWAVCYGEAKLKWKEQHSTFDLGSYNPMAGILNFRVSSDPYSPSALLLQSLTCPFSLLPLFNLSIHSPTWFHLIPLPQPHLSTTSHFPSLHIVIHWQCFLFSLSHNAWSRPEMMTY